MTPLDLDFRVDDEVVFNDNLGPANQRGKILHVVNGLATVRFKFGPRYDDYAQAEVKVSALRFGCHNHGAPFESQTLDEEGWEADGYRSGLAIGLHGQFYQAGGPGGVKLAKGLNPCRHFFQHDEFDQRNNRAFRKGWAAGQERAKMNKILDFTKPLRTVKDHRVVHYVGPAFPGATTHIISVAHDNGPPARFNAAPVLIDQYGATSGDERFSFAVENAPQPIKHRYVVKIDKENGLAELLVVVNGVNLLPYIDITTLDGRIISMEPSQ